MSTAQTSKIPPADLAGLVQRSGLSIRAFARVMGIPHTTLAQQLTGRCTIHGATLNAARFTLLRLGHSVTVDPVPAELLRPTRKL